MNSYHANVQRSSFIALPIKYNIAASRRVHGTRSIPDIKAAASNGKTFISREVEADCRPPANVYSAHVIEFLPTINAFQSCTAIGIL